MNKASKEVIMYTTEICPFCHAAKELLQSKGVSYKELDVTNDSDLRQKLIEMSGGRTTVPQIFLDGKNIGGYEELVAFYDSGGTL